ncbi:MAG: DNA polymerase/3'-5' exonuclease PolX, partial [Bacteroidetes bacterium]
MSANDKKLSNREIARAFRLLADLMELHGENPYKIRAYQNAYIQLRKLGKPLAEMDDEELARQKGVGKAIFSKIKELLASGTLRKLEEYLAVTPPGVVEMLEIKGLGPKKVRELWQELGIESPGELLYAINENRLLELKGFGPKTQDAIREQLLFWFRSQGKFHYATVALEWPAIEAALRAAFAERRIMAVGAFRRKCNVVDGLDLLIEGTAPDDASALEAIDRTGDWVQREGTWTGTWSDTIPLRLHFCEPAGWGTAAVSHTGDEAFVAGLAALTGGTLPVVADEGEVFAQAGCGWVAPELREGTRFLERARRGELPALIETGDIRGVIHAHSTWSDGIHSLREMALAARARGYEYLVISDHSRSAFYANGLDADRVRQQWEEVDRLNEELAP